MNSTAQGLAELVSKWLIHHELDLSKIRGQGYDGASVMSDKAGGVQKCFQDIITSNQVNGDNACALFVHCASHNLNLVINDAAAAIVSRHSFFRCHC